MSLNWLCSASYLAATAASISLSCRFSAPIRFSSASSAATFTTKKTPNQLKKLSSSRSQPWRPSIVRARMLNHMTYLWVFLERLLVKEVLLDEHLGLNHGDGRRRRQPDAEVQAQRRLGANPRIHRRTIYH
ncbi:Os02g0181200 [Oryza sativa Japonica Group]|uniref:Os02g0181200 protein n=1 Tax=Oryza sativa subsp. japonica TaxID=39947 RepID=A0A0P0VFL1_ORYSJ|nr:hypothetical protein EE612_009291 [Oryza sativa]BAS77307.1 Os02g0181200 [Oryza sativa Japonica Group]